MTRLPIPLSADRPDPALGYRADVDGLRGLAVLVVVGFHYFPDWLPSGFIGVDVFFVISGYLITGILLREFPRRGLAGTLADFYQRRIRRIFPAALLVLAFAWLLGWLLLFPFEYARLGKHIAASAAFVQNLVLAFESGYFDAGPIQKPLLHFWSLSVEEQFYLLWPLALWAALRLRWRPVRCIGLIAALSFALSVMAVESGHPVAAFYLPMSRAWELMAGAWLAALPVSRGAPFAGRRAEAAAWLGCALLLAGLVSIRPGPRFPGFAALLPVLGTVLLIAAGPASWLGRRLLSWRPLVWIGLVSYPLYLWHWTLWSLAHGLLLPGSSLSPDWVKLACAGLSLLAAWLTWRWLERPIRRRGRLAASLVLLALMALVGAAGGVVFLQQGLPGRPGALVPTALATAWRESLRDPPGLARRCAPFAAGPLRADDQYCLFGRPDARRRIVVVGDSHAGVFRVALDRYASTRDVAIVYRAWPGCPFLQNLRTTRSDRAGCLQAVDRLFALAASEPLDAVVWVERWSYYLGDAGGTERAELRLRDADGRTLRGREAFEQALEHTAAQFERLGVPLVFLQDNPQQELDLPLFELHAQNFPAAEFPREIDRVFNRTAVARAAYRRDQAASVRLLRALQRARPALVHLVPLEDALCVDAICPWSLDGQLLYRDDDHLSPAGVMRAFGPFSAALDRVLGLD